MIIIRTLRRDIAKYNKDEEVRYHFHSDIVSLEQAC